MSWSSGADSKHWDMPSMARWSPGQSATSPYGHHEPASRPATCRPLKSIRRSGPGSSARPPPAVRCSTRWDAPAGGQARSATQRPGISV